MLQGFQVRRLLNLVPHPLVLADVVDVWPDFASSCPFVH